jgi:hypothetical protein
LKDFNGIPAFAGAQPPGTFIEAFRQVLGTEAKACGPESCSVSVVIGKKR